MSVMVRPSAMSLTTIFVMWSPRDDIFFFVSLIDEQLSIRMLSRDARVRMNAPKAPTATKVYPRTTLSVSHSNL